METPNIDLLRQMPYSELRKLARKSGIKGNRKAEDIIAAIIEKVSHEDSFVTMENEIINSCSKNKEEKFNKDKLIASATPRRETYTVDSPFSAITKEMVSSSASPMLRELPDANDSLNVTMTRGSEKKTKKRKVSFVTPLRKSMRLNAMTPQFASVKDRPKTPIPVRSSSSKKKMEKKSLKLSLTPYKSDHQGRSSRPSNGLKEKRPSTPMPQSKQKRVKKNSLEKSAAIDSVVSIVEHLPRVLEVKSEKSTPRSDIKETATPGSVSVAKRNSATPRPASVAKRNSATPRPASVAKRNSTRPASAAKRNSATPRPASVAKRNSATPRPASVAKRNIATPRSSVKASTPRPVLVAKRSTDTTMSNTKRTATPISKLKGIVTSVSSGVKKFESPSIAITKGKGTITTPNFNKLHQKAFDKMESIDEYQRRKAANSAKKLDDQKRFQNLAKAKKGGVNSKIPKKFGGIPFIPSVTSIKDIKTNFASFGQEANSTLPHKKTVISLSHNLSAMLKKTPVAGKKVLKSVSCENTPLRKRTKFDLQASLSKKLPYKPHSGPLKPLPLSVASLNTTLPTLPSESRKKETENITVKTKRVQSRALLKGVRTNRRFELQMKNRKPTTA